MEDMLMYLAFHLACGLWAFWKRAKLGGLFDSRDALQGWQGLLLCSLLFLCGILGPMAAISTFLAAIELNRHAGAENAPHS